MICTLDIQPNKGEKEFFRALDLYLDNSHIVYKNREVYGREFDFCILIPEVGIAVVEVKGWSESMVKGVPGGDAITIRTDYGDELCNPRMQVRAYRFAVYNHIKNKLGKQPLVFHMVCYPFISMDFYRSRRMDLVMEETLTFLKEDLNDQEAFQSKLSKSIFFARNWGTDAFTPLLMKQVRSLFEPDVDMEEEEEPVQQMATPEKHDHLLPCYSALTFIAVNDTSWKAKLDDLVMRYVQGCRIYLMVTSQEMLNCAAGKISQVLINKGLCCDKRGNLQLGLLCEPLKPIGNHLTLFNWQVTLLGESESYQSIPSFVFYDGKGIDKAQMAWLETLDACQGFNLSQYLVEHVAPKKNVLVRAGAGTGKTYAMILRIAYLCNEESISPANLKDRIVMITFTNDAADNMKSRLKLCFQNYYMLTGLVDYMQMIAQVDRMQISTIHSYALRIIEKLGSGVGYGKELKITSGLYSRRRILERTLELYIEEQMHRNRDYLRQLAIPVYELREKLLDFVACLENKSIDVADMNPDQFGQVDTNQLLHELLVNVLTATEREFDKLLTEENRIFLGRLMAVLSNLVKEYPDRLSEDMSFGSRYLFIDEFQDTDDVQIEVLLKISEIVGYWMFVVGDIKQCIYRFRGAVEQAFEHLNIKENDSNWEPSFSLNKNYRTDKRLLEVYHSVFTLLGQPPSQLLTYKSDVDALVSDLVYNPFQPVEEFYRCIPLIKENERVPAVFDEIKRCKASIMGLLSQGEFLSKEDRTIAILVRENWQAEVIRTAGQKNGFPAIQTNTGGDLYQSVPALEMCVLLQAMLWNKPEMLAHLLSTNFFGVGLDRMELYKHRPQPGQRNAYRAKEMDYLTRLLNEALSAAKGSPMKWDDILKSLRMSPVLQVLRGLYDLLRPWNRIGEGEWLRAYYHMNVDLLFERIIQGCGLDNLTIHKLTNYITTNIVSRRAEECRWPEMGDADIRILCTTVHKSKGLEYGYVILPYTSFAINKPKRTGMDVMVNNNEQVGYSFKYADQGVLRNSFYNLAQEIEERMHEETRVLYVAMTRAIRSFAWMDLQTSNTVSWQFVLREGVQNAL